MSIRGLKRQLTILFAAFLISGISPFFHRLRADESPSWTINGNSVFQNGQKFAELKILDDPKLATSAHRGIAMRYEQTNDEVWISPKNGWKFRVDDNLQHSLSEVSEKWSQGASPCCGDDVGKLLWVRDIHFSDNGRLVYFVQAGLNGGVLHAFDIQKRKVFKIGRIP